MKCRLSRKPRSKNRSLKSIYLKLQKRTRKRKKADTLKISRRSSVIFKIRVIVTTSKSRLHQTSMSKNQVKKITKALGSGSLIRLIRRTRIRRRRRKLSLLCKGI